MRLKDIPKYERKNILNIHVFELINDTLNLIQVNTNYNEKQIDLLLCENHYCLITNLHTLINKDSHMQHVCRRCLTAFRPESILNDHIERCIYQKPLNITFSNKSNLEFEDYYMKIILPIRIYADFECPNIQDNDPDNPKIMYKQAPITVGFYLISPWENEIYTYQGTDCVQWFARQILTLEKDASNYF